MSGVRGLVLELGDAVAQSDNLGSLVLELLLELLYEQQKSVLVLVGHGSGGAGSGGAG